jgi:hypothetical protein
MDRIFRTATRSPLAVAQKALDLAQRALPAYSCKFSRKDFTQHQLFAILVLMKFFKTDYRGIIAILKDHSDLCMLLNLARLPDHSTLWYAEVRLGKLLASTPLWTQRPPTACDSSLLAMRPRAPLTPLASRPTGAPATMPRGS